MVKEKLHLKITFKKKKKICNFSKPAAGGNSDQEARGQVPECVFYLYQQASP